MGLVDRLRRVTMGRIEAFLETLEDPAAILPLLLRELDEHAGKLAHAEAKALAAVKSSQRRLNEEIGRVARLGRGAELALRFGEETTAREALAQQVVAEPSVRKAEENLAQAEKALADARELRAEILRQQSEIRRRADELRGRTIVTRGRSALAASEEAERQGASILDLVATMEDRPARDMPRPAALPPASLMERLGGLERRVTVEERLAALRRLAGRPPADGEEKGG